MLNIQGLAEYLAGSDGAQYLHHWRGCVLGKGKKDTDGCAQVLAGAHASHIAVEAAQGQGMSGAAHSVTSTLQLVKTVLGHFSNEARVPHNLSHSPNSFS